MQDSEINSETPSAVMQAVVYAAAERREAGLDPDIPVIHIGMAN